MAKKKSKNDINDDSQWEGVYKNALFRTEFLDWESYRNDQDIILNTYAGQPARALGQSTGHDCPCCKNNMTWNQGGPFINHHNGKPFGSVYSVLCIKCGGAFMMPHKYIYRVLTDMKLLEPVVIPEGSDIPEADNEGLVAAPSEPNDIMNNFRTEEEVLASRLPTVEVTEPVKKKRGRPPKPKASAS